MKSICWTDTNESESTMRWMLKLYETYNNCQNTTSIEPDSGDYPLPISHTTQRAHIEIVLDQNGAFNRARVLSKDDQRTLIPCTESSAGRSGSKPEPHPLSDKLQYIAKDFVDFGGAVTSGYASDPTEPYKRFEHLLQKWCESEFSHPKAKLVLRYVQKGSIMKDLVNYGILHLGTDGKLIDDREMEDPAEIFKVLPKGERQDTAFVRWSVEVPGDPQAKLHTDSELIRSWIKYYESTITERVLCYVTGEIKPATKQHPANLRRDGDKAKIISSNDSSGFTFRGRFETSDEACGVGYEVTQKAHNALKWLIRKQGYRRGDQAIVAWETSGNEIPDIQWNSDKLLSSDFNHSPLTAEEFAHRLNKKIAGYSAKVDDSNRIVVMGLDSATPGRMSITFYREITGSEFLKRIENWHETCCWFHDRVMSDPADNAKKRVRMVGAPSPNEIAESAYGSRVDEKLRNATVERLLPCIVDGRTVPPDLVDSAVRRASNRSGMENYEWEKTLSTACAVYRKYHEKEGFSMVLDENRKTRDYLYGRLLALADNIEGWALNEAGEGRQTTAARLMSRFAEHPFTTWRTIYLALTPYKARLGAKVASREKLITDIGSNFQLDEFNSDKKLSGEFLLGFYCQRYALMKHSDPDAEELNPNDDEN